MCVAGCLLLDRNCVLGICCLLLIAQCRVFVVRYALFVVGCLLFVVCCVLVANG